MNGRHIRVKRGQSQQALAREWAGDFLGAAAAKGIGAEHGARGQERQSHGGSLEAHGQGVIRPFGAGDLARLQNAAGMR